MSLPAIHRLKRSQDFRRVYRHGLRANGKYFTLRALKPRRQSTATPSLVGISIGLKVSKRAVVRNRIKRQIRAILRPYLPRLKPGWRLVVVVHPPAAECDPQCAYREFLRELEQMLVTLEVIHGH